MTSTSLNRAFELVRNDARAVLRDKIGVLDALKKKHIFITGGTGFLGTWLIELVSVLNKEHGFGICVTALSRNPGVFLQRNPYLSSESWLSFQESDVRYLSEIPRDVNFVIHAAALTDRRLFASQPSLVADVNTTGTARALKASFLLEEIEKFVLLSSGLVYGAQPWGTEKIGENFAGPLRCDDVNAVYAESKRMSEVLAQAAMSEGKLPVVVLRPFAFVGPHQSLQLPWAVTDFIRDSLNGGPIRIMGEGTTVRSLMYAADFAFGVLSALVNGRARVTYNLGSPEGVDLMTLAKLITQHFAPVPEIRTRVGQAGHEQTRLVPDIARIEKDLQCSVTTPLSAALQKTIEWNRLMGEGATDSTFNQPSKS